MDEMGETSANTMAPENAAQSDDDIASESSLDSLEIDESYVTKKQHERPGWLQHRPTQDMNSESAASQTNSSTWEIYKDLDILDPASRETGAPWIRLLRIEAGEAGQPIQCTLLKHQLWEDRDYLALSWSWGTQPRLKAIYLSDSRLRFAVSEHLWTALNNLRSPRRDTLVWIDAICIDQDNFVERAAQVGIMAQIYNGASKVMVWLGNSRHSGYEIPPEAPILERFWSLCRQPFPWWTRLWVVQECAYARACPVLMIDDEQIRMDTFLGFLDHEMDRSTVLDDMLIRTPGRAGIIELVRMPFEVWKMGTELNRHRMPLVERLRQTSGRTCNDPRDRIYALLGLIDEEEARLIKVDYRKSYRDLLLDVAEALDHYPYSDEGYGSALHSMIGAVGLIPIIQGRREWVQDRRNWLHENNAPVSFDESTLAKHDRFLRKLAEARERVIRKNRKKTVSYEVRQALALQQALVLTPTAPISHLRLLILDEDRPSTKRTKPLTDIYNGTCAGTKRDVQDVAFKNAMKHLYTLQGEVTDEQIIANLMPDTNEGQVSKGDMRYARTFVSALQSQNFSSGKGWMITKLESEIAWDDFKTVLFNAFRMAMILGRRLDDMSNAQFDANRDAAAGLLAKVVAAKGDTVAKIRTEIKGIKNNAISILRFDKREEAGFTSSALFRLEVKEIERLEGLISSLEAWPASEFPGGALDGADTPQLGDARLTLAESSPSTRKEFFHTLAESCDIFAGANQATADSIEFLQSLDQAPFMEWKREQFCHVAECMFEHIGFRHRIASKQALYVDDFE